MLEPIIGRPIWSDAIMVSWDDILRLTASIKAGVVAPSAMLRKLGAYKRQNRLDFALAEVGRIERADSDGSRPPIPRRCRPSFRFDPGHHSAMKPATA